MAQIASASGIAIGQNYRDFANKEAIIAAICEADLGGWLEEEKLEAAVAAGDRDAILGWIEKIATDTPTREDRRLMCELLAEVDRKSTRLNPVTHAHIVCRLLLEQTTTPRPQQDIYGVHEHQTLNINESH